MADRRGQAVVATKSDLMAGVAADVVTLRKPGIEIEHLSELDLRRGCRIIFESGSLGGDRLKQVLSFLHQRILRRKTPDDRRKRHCQGEGQLRLQASHVFPPRFWLGRFPSRRPLRLARLSPEPS